VKGTVECIKCHAHMESGWVADKTQGGLTQQNWSAGEPQPSFWTGLKVEKDQVVPVTTLRCPTCGYLESYAIAQSQNGVIVSGRSSSQRQLAAVLIGLVVLLIGLSVVLLIRPK
jgi:predicted nucleic-acid-binding Zn-ribbon protein